MILTRLEEIAKLFGLTSYNHVGPYWDEVLFYWDAVNDDPTDGWVIKYDKWRKLMRICTQLQCDGSYHTPIRLKPWESVEIDSLTVNNVEKIKNILFDLQASIPKLQKEMKVLLNKKQAEEIAKDFR